MRSLQAFLALFLSVNLMQAMKTAPNKLDPTAKKTTSNAVVVGNSDSDEFDFEDDMSMASSLEASDEERVEEDDEEEEKMVQNGNNLEYFATKKDHLRKAWQSAGRLIDRDPTIWRHDKVNNVIISLAYTISSPLAYKALVNRGEGGEVSFDAIQEEYYGRGEEDNHLNALKYVQKDSEQDDLLSLIEIALRGNVNDGARDSYCWVPSQIHQDLFLRDQTARQWHENLFAYDKKYGMTGHNLAFQHMNVALKDVRRIPIPILDSTVDQKNTYMYIHNYQKECSQVVDQIYFVEDPAKRAADIKNNWGLPRVPAFVEPKKTLSTSKKVKRTAIVPGSSGYAAAVSKPKSSSKTSKTIVLNDDEWPTLGSKPAAVPAPAAAPAVVAKSKTTRIPAPSRTQLNLSTITMKNGKRIIDL